MRIKPYLLFLACFVSVLCKAQKTELIVQLGHTDAVLCSSISSDGNYIITGSTDHTIKLWQVQSGLLIRTFYGLRKEVKGAAFDISDQNIFAIDAEGRLITWNLQGDVLKQQKLKTGITSMNIAPDKKKIVFTADKAAYQYELGSGKYLDSIFVPEGAVYAVYHSSKADLFAVADGSYTKPSIFISDKGSVKQFAVKTSILNQLRFVSDNVLAFTSGKYNSGDYGAIDIKSGELKWINNNTTYGFEAVEKINDKLLAVSTYRIGMLHIVEAATGKLVTSTAVHTGMISHISSYSNWFITSASDRSTWRWDAATLQPVNKFSSISDYVWTASLASDGKTMATAGGSLDNEQSIRMWDISRGKLLRRFNDLPDMMTTCAISPNMKYLASGTAVGQSAWWELPEGFNRGDIAGPTGKVNAVAFHSRGNFFLAGGETGTLLLHRVKLNTSEKMESNKEGVSSLAFSSNGNLFLVGTHAGTTELWDFNKRAKIKEWNTHTDAGHFFDTAVYVPYNTKFRMNITGAGISSSGNAATVTTVAFSKDGKWILAGGASFLVLIDASSGNVSRTINGLGGVSHAAFSNNGNLVAVGSADHRIRIIDVTTGNIIKILTGHENEVRSVQFSADDKYLISGSLDTQVKIWDLSKEEMLLGMLALTNSNEYIIYNNHGYYLSSKGAGKVLAFRRCNDVYPFTQFDIRYNRPDIIIEELNKVFYSNADNSPIKSLQQAYNKAYKKRLQRSGYSEDALNGELHVPTISILTSQVSNNVLKLMVKASDDLYKLDRLQVYMNEVPLYGTKGLSIKATQTKETIEELTIPLTAGENNVQVSSYNDKGAESFRENLKLMSSVANAAPKTYVIGISVSQYKDAAMNLNYSVKDGRDIVQFFATSGKNVEVDSLFDQNAVVENIRALKQKLQHTNPEDEVIVFVSGHGMLDKENDFYFATQDIDFDDPAKRGLPYEELEGLLDGIPARKKLLLIDACHSGEVDTTATTENTPANTITEPGVKTYTFKSNIKNKAKQSLGLENSFELMQELFTNLSQGNGTLVISAAAGVGFALESAEWNNGLFTFTVLNALKNKLGDDNKNGKISVNELKNFVTKEVDRLSRGQQKPTTRKELSQWDWELN